MDRSLRFGWLTAVAVLLAGCATRPIDHAPAVPLLDQRFAPPATPVEPEAALRLTPAMRQFVQTRIAGGPRGSDPRWRLVDAVRRMDTLRLEYDASRTRTAAEAFEERAGNCLSLVLMTAALAQEAGLRVQFQSVEVDTLWNRQGNLLLASSHVNLSLGRRALDERALMDNANRLMVDFLPPEDLRGLRLTPLDEPTVLAMYANNRAVEALAVDAVDEAYWWSRAALQRDPDFLPGYNTLAVVYQRRGELVAAELALRHVQARAPDHLPMLANLIQVLQAQGRALEAAELRQRLARLEPVAPYALLDQALAASRAGQDGKAQALLEREAARSPEAHEPIFWLAVLAYRRGDLNVAREYLMQAQAQATTRADRQRYAAKLDWLRQQAAALH